MSENQPRYQHLSAGGEPRIVTGGLKIDPQRSDLVVLEPRYPAEPRCDPAGSAAKTNPAAPLTPYIYNGVAGWDGNELNDPKKHNPAKQRDTPHARAEVECKNCHDSRTFYAHVSPDPQRRGPARVEREAAGWLQSHPCYLTTAHPKRLHRGAAA